VFGLAFAPSFLRAIYSIPSFGNREISRQRLPPRYQQKYQQNDRLERALPRTFTNVFKCAAQILLKNQESNQGYKLLLLLMFYAWCPWPAVAYSHNHLNLSSFYPSIAADTSRNTSKMTRGVSSSQK
jgi:hypothetical protein